MQYLYDSWTYIAFPWKHTHIQIKLSFISPKKSGERFLKNIITHETILVHKIPKFTPFIDFLCVSSQLPFCQANYPPQTPPASHTFNVVQCRIDPIAFPPRAHRLDPSRVDPMLIQQTKGSFFRNISSFFCTISSKDVENICSKWTWLNFETTIFVSK